MIEVFLHFTQSIQSSAWMVHQIRPPPLSSPSMQIIIYYSPCYLTLQAIRLYAEQLASFQ